MKKSKPNKLFLVSICFILVTIVFLFIFLFHLSTQSAPTTKATPPLLSTPTATPSSAITPTPTPKTYQTIDHYSPPIIQNSPSYTLIFIGDSMTESLGENFDDLRKELKKYFPEKVFGLFNYGFGSTNILSTEDRLNQETIYKSKVLPAILGRYFDIILIESSGNNPLSQFPLEEGLQKQTAALDFMVAEIASTHPKSLIVFIATIAPSQAFYGKGAVELSALARNQWANERRNYIENHINYAKNHNIPLINVYEKSIDKNGLTLTKYLDTGNYIHPSAEGVHLISKSIADYLWITLPKAIKTTAPTTETTKL